MTSSSAGEFDFDYIVIGSGFGGSVSAMRLAQKGYKVAVIESGRRWHADEFPRRNWNLRKFLWMPRGFCYGIQRMNLLRNVFILSGAGVGGGSLNYGNTLYVPPESFFLHPSVVRLGGKAGLMPYYDLAKRMLGVTTNPVLTAQDELLRQTATEIDRHETFGPTPVGVYFGQKDEPSPDPYFEGEGPDRVGCALCGECMTGCKKNAKNTLDKNYLYFAQKFGAQIFAENKVTEIRPLSPDGDRGYLVKTRKTTGLAGSLRGLALRSRGIVLAAGTLGTLSLLIAMKQKRRLPRLTAALGRYVRTNSEAIVSVKAKTRDVDFTRGVAITSSIHLDDHTHVEPVRYGRGHDFMGLLAGILTEGGGWVPRPIRAFFNALRHPVQFLRLLNPVGTAYRSVILLVMQTVDNYLIVSRRRRLIWPFTRSLTSRYGTEKRNPTWIPVAYDFGRRLARRMDGVPANIATENLMNAPITAHIMGGCVIGRDGEEGVIDEQNRVIGYRNMLVADGSQIPENLGVNPALSITAFSERAMSFVPPKEGKEIRTLRAEQSWGLAALLLQEDPGSEG